MTFLYHTLLPPDPSPLGMNVVNSSSGLAITSSGVLYLSEIFAKVNKNGLLKTQPAVIHFDGYQVGGVHQQTLVSQSSFPASAVF